MTSINQMIYTDTIKKGITVLLILFLNTIANAIPAKPGQTRQLTLDDGTTVTALLVGDEYGHYWLTDDGRAFMDIGDSYVPVDKQVVHEKAQIRRNKSNQRRTARLAASRGSKAKEHFTGHKKGLIIMVNFANKSFLAEHTDSLFDEIANRENYKSSPFKGSMYDYFRDQSRGEFLLNFDIAGPITLSKDYEYYGTNDSEGNDLHPGEMVIEALELADSIVDYTDYDWNGDGTVEQVFLIYAGKGEADGGTAKTIWPHEYTLYEAYFDGDGSGPQIIDGVTIDTYACGSELNGFGRVAGIGTMCHEFSHCLGYPDFYDTDYSGGQGMFEWDLMDSGSYNDDGYLPAGFTSYERWFAGWLEPTELSETTTVSNMADLENGGGAYIIYNKGYINEYFLLENRQKTGWDAGIPGSGLLILHVDYDEKVWEMNEPNDNPSHQRMTWIAADNKYQYTKYNGVKYFETSGAVNDPFPYDSINAFNANTIPAAKFYNLNADGTYYLDSSIEDITQNTDGTVSFRFVVPTAGIPTINAKSADYDHWYDMSGRPLDRVPDAPGLYIGNGNKVLIK
jgi:M6 family metalloprotease-like protein